MYRGKDRQNKSLFSSLFPFGGSLDPENRWLRIKKLIPWEKLESRYESYFSKLGRGALDGFVFLDHLSSENFPEAARVKSQIKQYETLFGKKPPYVVADKIYGNRENRRLLKKEKIRDAFQPLGRKASQQNPATRWQKQKQREQNQIEGSFGHAKNHFSLDKIKYYIENGSEIWVRLGLLGMNLQTAAKRI